MSDRKSILIIDDEVDLCMLMRAYYLRKNYIVFVAHQFYEALGLAKDHNPNIILLDFATCRNVQEDIKKLKEAAPDAEIIIIGTQQMKEL